jgi:hypothetical protein
MEKMIIKSVLVAFLTLAVSGVVEGKSYRPISIHNSDYTVEIPANITLPDTSKLELAVSPRKNPHNPNLLMVLYLDPAFQYFDESSGEEVFPYMELIKKEKGDFHLVTLAFINEDLKIEVYEDRGAFGGRSSDRLEKFLTKEKERLIRKVPR